MVVKRRPFLGRSITTIAAVRVLCVSDDTTEEPPAREFRRFGEVETQSSPLYTALSRQMADDAALRAVLDGAPRKHPTLFFGCVQRVLADHPDDPLAGYYRSFGGDRVPDAELAKTFESFVTAHQAEIAELHAAGETQTNEPLRAAQLRPAFGWAQACIGRPLGLIEIGTSAGLLLHPDRYAYEYEFEDGSVLQQGDVSGLVLHCPVRGGATAKSLSPFVTKDLRIASRVGLDLNPLNPADADARAWLRALIWPEHVERRTRLDAAIELTGRSPVRLRKGDALQILGDAVGTVSTPTVPCVFASNALAHFPEDSRARFADLIRELGTRRDLILLMKEPAAVGLGLFTGLDADPDLPLRDPTGEPVESLSAVVYQSGRERLFSLGTAGPHGAWLDWSPTQNPQLP
jgi:hypothetical protein